LFFPAVEVVLPDVDNSVSETLDEAHPLHRCVVQVSVSGATVIAVIGVKSLQVAVPNIS
jgi:hypothetical protein